MMPNSKEAGIAGMAAVDIYGKWSSRDMKVVKIIFEECRQIEQEGILEIELSGKSVALPNLKLSIQREAKTMRVNELSDVLKEER